MKIFTPRLPDNTAYDLWHALNVGESCPVCRVIERMVTRYLDRISEEAVNEIEFREEVRAAGGFCAPHGKQWLVMNDVLGTALIYNDVLSTALDVIVANSKGTGQEDAGLVGKLRGMLAGSAGPTAGRALADALEPTGPCPVCEYTLQAEAQVVDSFARSLDEVHFRMAYGSHRVGLCMPHFRSVLRLSTQTGALTQAHISRLRRAAAELKEVIRKADHRYHDEPRGEEFAAPRRSVEQAAGLLPTQLNLPK